MVTCGAPATAAGAVGATASATLALGAPHADETTATEMAMSASAGRRGTDMLGRVYREAHDRPRSATRLDVSSLRRA